MNKINKYSVKIITVILVIFLTVITGISIQQGCAAEQKTKSTLILGFPEGQAKGMQKELEHAFKEQSILESGDALLKDGKFDEAIKEYEKAISLAKMSGSKAIVFISMANAYEKKRDYKKALELVIVDRDKYVNDWAREPIVERAKYLEYALQGEYDLAVEHAQKAIEADVAIYGGNRPPRSDYIERLNDLKVAKDYILSLKEKQAGQ
ncbi:MAG: tetratricopeptide repeat protein [Candidatus Omnitrophota bacterium]